MRDSVLSFNTRSCFFVVIFHRTHLNAQISIRTLMTHNDIRYFILTVVILSYKNEIQYLFIKMSIKTQVTNIQQMAIP